MFGIPLKPMLYVGAVIAVLGFAKWAHSSIYTSGFDAARIEFQNAAIEQQNIAIATARAVWESEQEAAGIQIVVEEKIVEKIKIIREEIPTIVERIVELTPECSNLGEQFVGVFNAAVIAANSGSIDSPDIESSIDPTL